MINQTAKMDDVPKIDFLMKKSSDLLAEMRRVDRENQKNRKRGDVLQKERDNSRSDLSKQVQLKEKLEKLCRELQKDNNKLKVQTSRQFCCRHVNRADAGTRSRQRIRNFTRHTSMLRAHRMNVLRRSSPGLRAAKKIETCPKSRLWT